MSWTGGFSWYRRKGGKYHAVTDEGYVREGRALCGANVRGAAFVVDAGREPALSGGVVRDSGLYSQCRHCRAQVARLREALVRFDKGVA
jgi:hypothetical protein